MTAHELNHDSDSPEEKKRDDKAILFRFLFTLLFVVLGWLSLWVLAAVVLIQFGYLIFDGGISQTFAIIYTGLSALSCGAFGNVLGLISSSADKDTDQDFTQFTDSI